MTATKDDSKRDYRDTLFLPKTDFPMRAGLPKKEPEWLAYWNKIGLFERLREQSKGREQYILHDGPPYANGHIHMGTALNKICLLYTSPSPRDKRQSRMPSSA